MSRINKILISVLLAGLSFAVIHTVWWAPGKLVEAEARGKVFQGSNTSTSESTSNQKSRNAPEGNNIGDLVEPMKAVEDFEIQFQKIKDASGENWVIGLKELAAITNRLGKQSGFKAAIATALMVKKISDLVIIRLMAREVSSLETLRGLESFSYEIPTEHQMVQFICELQPDGMKEREKHPNDAVFDFASRFEPEIIFPDSWLNGDKVPLQLLSGENLTFSLLVIVGAKLRLDTARITAIYLQKGGDSSLRGDILEADLNTKVGEEIGKIPIPFFGEEKPTAGSISFIIDNAIGMSQ